MKAIIHIGSYLFAHRPVQLLLSSYLCLKKKKMVVINGCAAGARLSHWFTKKPDVETYGFSLIIKSETYADIPPPFERSSF